MFREGALYSCSDYYLMLFPSKEVALQALSAHHLDVFGIKATIYQISDRMVAVRSMTAYLADQMDCHVYPYTPNDLFLCVEASEQCMQILYNENIYWIITFDIMNIIIERHRSWVVQE